MTLGFPTDSRIPGVAVTIKRPQDEAALSYAGRTLFE
jgi:hypothetical protein